MAQVEERHTKAAADVCKDLELSQHLMDGDLERIAQALAGAEAGDLRPRDYCDGGDELADTGYTYRELDAALKQETAK